MTPTLARKPRYLGTPPPAKPQNPETSVVAASDRRLQSKNLGRERGPGFPGEGKETHGTLELQGRSGEGSAGHS